MKIYVKNPNFKLYSNILKNIISFNPINKEINRKVSIYGVYETENEEILEEIKRTDMFLTVEEDIKEVEEDIKEVEEEKTRAKKGGK